MKRYEAIGAVLVAAALGVGCGGKSAAGANEPVGDQHVADDLDVDEGTGVATGDTGAATGDTGAATGDTGAATGDTGDTGANPPMVTFRLHNSGTEDLVLSMDRGLQPILSAYSGTPPNAKSILMYPTDCTAACSVAEAQRCPVCEKPKQGIEERESEQRLVIPPGQHHDFPWDGQIHVYQKTKGTFDGKKRSCNCFHLEPVPDDTYTVRACGLRITKSAKKTSKYQCPTNTMTLPAEGPLVVEFDFPEPE